MNSVITIQESARLVELEGKISSGLQTFVDVGEALMEIRDSRLYRGVEHKTFEAYCREKWNFSKPYATQLIGAAKVVRNIETVAIATVPKTESQARPLAKLPAEQQPAAWEKAVEKAGGEQPTAFRPSSTSSINRSRKQAGNVDYSDVRDQKGRVDSMPTPIHWVDPCSWFALTVWRPPAAHQEFSHGDDRFSPGLFNFCRSRLGHTGMLLHRALILFGSERRRFLFRADGCW